MPDTAQYQSLAYRHMPTVRPEDRIPAVIVTEGECIGKLVGVALPDGPWLHVDANGSEIVWSITLYVGVAPGWFILRNGEFRPVEP